MMLLIQRAAVLRPVDLQQLSQNCNITENRVTARARLIGRRFVNRSPCGVREREVEQDLGSG